MVKWPHISLNGLDLDADTVQVSLNSGGAAGLLQQVAQSVAADAKSLMPRSMVVSGVPAAQPVDHLEAEARGYGEELLDQMYEMYRYMNTRAPVMLADGDAEWVVGPRVWHALRTFPMPEVAIQMLSQAPKVFGLLVLVDDEAAPDSIRLVAA